MALGFGPNARIADHVMAAGYSLETEHGSRKKKQKQWAKEVPEMFREATEALIAFRGSE